MLSLLVGKDSLDVKANLFVDLVIGRKRFDADNVSIKANSIRLKRALKLITYFSEMFPKQYQGEFLGYINDHLEFKDKVARVKDTHQGMPLDDLQWSNDFIDVEM